MKNKKLTLISVEISTRSFPHPSSAKARVASYRCECGDIRDYNYSSVKNSGQYPEGCILCKDRFLTKKLGQGYSKLKKKWFYMLERCYNREHPSYHSYGGKGVIVCKEWHDFDAFKEWAYEHGYTDENNWQIDKDFMAWAHDIEPEYSPRSCIIISGSKITQLRRRLKERSPAGKYKLLSHRKKSDLHDTMF